MYYANEFIYYYVTMGEMIYIQYTGCTLYKSKEEAIKNAEREWKEISSDKETLTDIRTRAMILWNDKEEQASSTEK